MNDEDDPLQDAIKILRDRMEQYPEEFSPQTAKGWTRFWKTTEQIFESMQAQQRGDGTGTGTGYRNPLWFLTPEERETLYEGLRIAARQTFTNDVMSALTANADPTPTALHELKQKLAFDARQTMQRRWLVEQKLQGVSQDYLGSMQQEAPEVVKPPAGILGKIANRIRWAT